MSRPDRPLVVKTTYERWNKRITFASARNCTYQLLRDKVEQCFSLFATSYAIAYKDDDGEVTDITNDSDLTEAIQYFQAGSDDQPMSSAASILSGRSFGSRKITLRVQIKVDYDGPSLSDTSSMASMEEYRGRNASQLSFSLGASPSVDLDDDSVTVSSRDTGGAYLTDEPPALHVSNPSRLREVSSGTFQNQVANKPPDTHFETQVSSSWARPLVLADAGRHPDPSATEAILHSRDDPFSDEYRLAATSRYPEDPSAVFERLKMEEDEISFIDPDPLSGDDRGVAWLRDQNDRLIRSMLGTSPEPSDSDGGSIALEHGGRSDQLGGDLALRRDPRGKYYYSYTSVGSSCASQIHDSGYEDGPSVNGDSSISGMETHAKPRPTSMNLNWLAAQRIPTMGEPSPNHPLSELTSSRAILHSFNSDPLPVSKNRWKPDSEILREMHRFPIGPPPDQLTDCSDCGVLLDSIRYVCSTCGEKTPVEKRSEASKDRCTNFESRSMTYPPPSHRTLVPSPAASSRTFTGESDCIFGMGSNYRQKPLPSLPSLSSSQSTLAVPNSFRSDWQSGYELCSGCIESAGVNHAIEVGLAPDLTPGRGNSSPSSPEETQLALSQWRRSAPKQKGHLRHGYLEKVWGHFDWEDVEQDECHTCKCSTCDTIILNKRYKCASCLKYNLCRACYSQVHDIHPTHAFLVVPDKPVRSHSEPDTVVPDHNDEQSMKHPGVKCAHCMLDILGARFHCAICESIDICSNCESAGLPGNLDSSDGGHNSSHIMIKIPYPLETTEVQTASRRAIHLWTGRDAANVQRATPRSKASSVVSSYARTVVGSRARGGHSSSSSVDEHHIFCNGCSTPVIGIRYQCANCPSSPTPYSLCKSCEARSYVLHDPMHVFFKLPRPVQRPIESPFPMIPKLYKSPAGPNSGSLSGSSDPKEYLKDVLHSASVCDRCMDRIQGEWFRCAYCAKDLCDACEELDTHDDSHIFLVFKSPVDMQLFRNFADLENPHGSPPVIPYPVF